MTTENECYGEGEQMLWRGSASLVQNFGCLRVNRVIYSSVWVAVSCNHTTRYANLVTKQVCMMAPSYDHW